MKINDKKEIIIQNAKEIFYNDGYINASMEKIAIQCGIQKQLISYYFGTKANLGQHVYEEISNHFLHVFESKANNFGITDSIIADAASALWIPRYYKEDEKAHRFYDEFVYGSLSDISNFKYEEERHLIMAVKYPKDITREIMEADYVSARYAAKGILYHYCKGDLSINAVDFEKYYLFLCYEPFIKDRKELNRIYCQACELLNKITIRIKPNFIIE